MRIWQWIRRTESQLLVVLCVLRRKLGLRVIKKTKCGFLFKHWIRVPCSSKSCSRNCLDKVSVTGDGVSYHSYASYVVWQHKCSSHCSKPLRVGYVRSSEQVAELSNQTSNSIMLLVFARQTRSERSTQLFEWCSQDDRAKAIEIVLYKELVITPSFFIIAAP